MLKSAKHGSSSWLLSACAVIQHGCLLSQLDRLPMRPAGPASITKIIQNSFDLSVFQWESLFIAGGAAEMGGERESEEEGVRMWIEWAFNLLWNSYILQSVGGGATGWRTSLSSQGELMAAAPASLRQGQTTTLQTKLQRSCTVTRFIYRSTCCSSADYFLLISSLRCQTIRWTKKRHIRLCNRSIQSGLGWT